MRPSFLDRRGSLYGLFLITMFLACVAFFIGMMIKDSFARPSRDYCVINRLVYSNAMVASRHPLLIEFPADLSRQFIIGWNTVIRGLEVPPDSDRVIVYDSPRAPTFRVAFFKGECLVDAFDIPGEGFWKVIEVAHGARKWSI